MIIDFHTHTFPNSVAPRAIASLSQRGNIKPYSDGTLNGLKESMKRSGVDYSVILPVATSVHQVQSINRLGAQLSGKDGIIYAAAIHPDCDNLDALLDDIKSAGFFGIKLHPDYQGVYFDDPRYINIMEKAAQRDLITITHAGIDVAYRDDVHCTPDMVLHVLNELRGIIEYKLVLAHLGGFELEDEVMDKLVGKPVYMDTAAVLSINPEKNREIIRRHGADFIMFATDSPWAPQDEFIKLITSPEYGLSDEELEKIMYKNALKLLCGVCDIGCAQ